MTNSIFTGIASAFRMTDDLWRRHANPWSVFTRFAAIPAMAIAIWSRVWIGWWALLPVFAVVLWLWINPRVFSPVSTASSWAAKGIYGEKLWLHSQASVPDTCRILLRRLMGAGVIGFIILAWGLYMSQVWPTVTGIILVGMAQLWRIDRLGILYDAIESNHL